MADRTARDVSRIVEEATGSSVTEDVLLSFPDIAESLSPNEQPHFVLRGIQMDIERVLEDDVAREDSRRRVMAAGDLLTVVTDERLLFVIERSENVEARTVPYATLTSVEYEAAAGGNQRLVATGVETSHSIDTSRSDDEECRRAATFADDHAEAVSQSGESTQAEDPLARLERLANLKERGMVSDAEFEAKKRELLDRL